MQLQSDKTSLVIAGAWNPAILSPQWIGQNALGFAADHEFPVRLQLPIQDFGQSPRFNFETLSITAALGALTFFLDSQNADQVAKSFHVASRVLELLPHTPISGVGVNFSFEAAEADTKVAATFSSHECLLSQLGEEEESSMIVQQSWQATVNLSDHLANVTCTKAGGRVEVSLNHHFNVSSATQASTIVNGNDLFNRLLELSGKLIAGLENGGDS